MAEVRSCLLSSRTPWRANSRCRSSKLAMCQVERPCSHPQSAGQVGQGQGVRLPLSDQAPGGGDERLPVQPADGLDGPSSA